MRNENGVTLISVIIYIIVMVIVVTIISTLSMFFYNNIIQYKEKSEISAEYNKFNMRFLEDIKEKGNDVEEIQTNKILFTNGNSYTFQDNMIFRNKVKICDNVYEALFKIEIINSRKVITVLLIFGTNNQQAKTTQYVIGM